MDPLYLALSYFRRKKLDKCISQCEILLKKNPYDEAAWSLKTKALTEQVYVDEVEMDEIGLAEILMDETSIASVARPGTSLKTPGTARGISAGIRPTTQSGRPVSGFLRPGTQLGQPGSMEQALRTPRTAHTARPVSSASGRFVRLGTASMLSQPDGPFINMSRLNLDKYAGKDNVARALFEYIFYHENDVRNALELASLATQKLKFKDWWWKVQLGKCYYRLGMFRDAENQFKSALKHEVLVDTLLYLGKVYQRLDQPLLAIDTYKSGLEKYPGESSLLTAVARTHDGLSNPEESIKLYKEVLQHDSTSIEAIACIATQYFYTDQPEIALSLYRRLLQMGVFNAEVFNNLGLCCYHAQQYDMTLKCFERALAIAGNDELADIWYNISHVALGIGDYNLAYQCLRLAVSYNNNHSEAYNNLGVLELRRGDIDRAQAFFATASSLFGNMYEAHYNQASISNAQGDLQSSYVSVRKSLESFPDHIDSKHLLKTLQQHFMAL